MGRRSKALGTHTSSRTSSPRRTSARISASRASSRASTGQKAKTRRATPGPAKSKREQELRQRKPSNADSKDASMDRYAQDNRANQRNTNHTSTGPGRPAEKQGSRSNENNRANQLNPNNKNYAGNTKK